MRGLDIFCRSLVGHGMRFVMVGLYKSNVLE
jgi:hypothetical protein